jgi:hypothetical protein
MALSELQPGQLPFISDPRWKLVQEIVASRCFAKASRLSSLLTYICSKALRGNTEDLNERQIGIDVFERSVNYRPADDSIVRAHARLLRNRLEHYFTDEGKGSAWTIQIPKGSYTPVFEERAHAPAQTQPAPISIPVKEAASEKLSRTRTLFVVAASLLLVGTFAVVWRMHTYSTAARQPGEPLWSILLAPSQHTLLVPADSMLSFLQTERKVPLTLSEYLNKRHESIDMIAAAESLPRGLSNFSDHQYTSIADLDMAFLIGRLAQSHHAQVEVRYARDMVLSETRHTNLILIGGPRANPWVQLFTNRVDYQLDDQPADGQDFVNVQEPRSEERNRYKAEVNGNETYSLAVVAFVSGLEDGDHVLLIEGTDMAGTEGACDFLVNSNASSNFLKKLMRPDGTLNHFEVLLECKTVNGNASAPLVLAYRVLP